MTRLTQDGTRNMTDGEQDMAALGARKADLGQRIDAARAAHLARTGIDPAEFQPASSFAGDEALRDAGRGDSRQR